MAGTPSGCRPYLTALPMAKVSTPAGPFKGAAGPPIDREPMAGARGPPDTAPGRVFGETRGGERDPMLEGRQA